MSAVSNLNNSTLHSVLRKAVIGAILAFVSACVDPTGTCSWENRHVGVSGRGYQDNREMATGQANPSLAEHVTAIALVSRTQSFPDVELPFPGPTWSTYYASWSQYEGHLMNAQLNPNPDLDGLFDSMAANLVAFRITTDLPAQPVIMVWLAPTHKLDWFRPSCGG